MKLRNLVQYVLWSYIVMSALLLIGTVFASNPATFPQLLTLFIVNVGTALYGLIRLKLVKGEDKEGEAKIGIIGAQHSWLILSVTTAVLSLLFGKFFEDNIITMSIEYVFLTMISIIAIYSIVEVARRKIPFLE